MKIANYKLWNINWKFVIYNWKKFISRTKRENNPSFTYNMKTIYKLEECEPKKLVKELEAEVIKTITFARERYYERKHDIICREYFEEADEEFGGLMRDYYKEMSENLPSYFDAIQKDSEDIWKKYAYIQEAYVYLRKVAPTLLTKHKAIVDGMFVIVDYHNEIQSRLAMWKDMIKYYNERNQPVVLVKANPNLY